MLPLAIPTYLAAYCFTELLDFTGPVQQLVRAITGGVIAKDYWFPQIRSFPGAVFVLEPRALPLCLCRLPRILPDAVGHRACGGAHAGRERLARLLRDHPAAEPARRSWSA